ncbi:MAG: hypothetical protein SPM09_09220 [Fibrobacter sp.]|uniref:hypothetical protein n=1 Tax=Fibrobacter sp. TaxID=35828 RepID=UPI002A91278E|nr:hypothetical protein [Fibrobacter sp.]MDY6264575.1 hypothetical protein [Fibrobacter sp.]
MLRRIKNLSFVAAVILEPCIANVAVILEPCMTNAAVILEPVRATESRMENL